MRCFRWMLAAATAAAPGCKVPDTLGLPCVTHEHCDPGQHCGPEGTCIAGMPPMPTDPTTGLVSTGPAPSTGSGGSGADTTLVLEGTSSGSGGSTSTGGSSGSTGAACGQAVGSCDALDVLFVMDNSDSMGDEYAGLIAVLPNVLNTFYAEVERTCTYHLGVTATDTTVDFQPQRCRQLGALMRRGAFPEACDPWSDPEHVPWVSEADQNPNLTCLFTVSTDGGDNEAQADTLLAAVGVGGELACNEGFIREGVPLLVVIITDEDDDDDGPGLSGSSDGYTEWWDQLVSIKDPSELGVLLLAATEEPGCDWDGSAEDQDGAEWAQNLSSFMAYAIGNVGPAYALQFQVVNICQNSTEIANGLVDAAQVILPALCDNAG
jgi:hypothetical protein